MIFVDSSAWLALADPAESNHRSALALNDAIRRGVHGYVVSTDFVLDDTLTIVRARAGIEKARLLSRVILDSRNVHPLWVEETHFRAALDLMFSRPDKTWGVTDCTSFVLMRDLSLRVAFSYNRDFRQAGFETVPD